MTPRIVLEIQGVAAKEWPFDYDPYFKGYRHYTERALMIKKFIIDKRLECDGIINGRPYQFILIK